MQTTCHRWWSLIIVEEGVFDWHTDSQSDLWQLFQEQYVLGSEYIKRKNKEPLVLPFKTMFEFVTADYFKWDDSNA